MSNNTSKRSRVLKAAYYLSGAFAVRKGFSAVRGSSRPLKDIENDIQEALEKRPSQAIDFTSDQYSLSFKMHRAICWVSFLAFISSIASFCYYAPNSENIIKSAFTFISFLGASAFSYALLYKSSVSAFYAGSKALGKNPEYEDYKSALQLSMLRTILPVSIEGYKK